MLGHVVEVKRRGQSSREVGSESFRHRNNGFDRFQERFGINCIFFQLYIYLS